MTGELHTFLRSRRSVRQFKPRPVPAEAIERLLETTIHAPSAHNSQPWRFVVITSVEVKRRLGQAITGQFRQDMAKDGLPETEIAARVERSQRRLMQAPLVILLCQDMTARDPSSDPRRRQAETLMGAQSVAMAGLQLLLAAHAEGLSGVWICWPLFAPQATRAALHLPSTWEPQGMVFLGDADEQPEMPERKPLSEVTLFLED